MSQQPKTFVTGMFLLAVCTKIADEPKFSCQTQKVSASEFRVWHRSMADKPIGWTIVGAVGCVAPALVTPLMSFIRFARALLNSPEAG